MTTTAITLVLACHSERSEEPPHFAFAVAFALAVAFASRYPKALALGLSAPHKQRGFSPGGMLSSPSHNFLSA